LSANKVGDLSSVMQKSDIIVQLEHVLFSTIKSAIFLDIGHRGNCLQWEINICFTYLFSFLLYNVYFRF